MAEPETLKRVRERATDLVALDLRSTAIVLGQMRGLIVEAHRLGHSHKAIHASLEAAGLKASWNTYKSCLMRMKKAARGSPDVTDAGTAMSTGLNPPLPTTVLVPAAEPSGLSGLSDPVTSPVTPVQPEVLTRSVHFHPSATRVMDALNEARKAATSRDYAQVSRDLQRQQHREQRSQRNSPKDRS